MKTATLLLIACISSGTFVFAQSTGTKIPPAVLRAFNKQHPGINPKWENEKGKYEAGFKQRNKKISVLYNTDGSVAETETSITIKALPATVISYVNQHKMGAIKEAARIEKADGSIQYEAEVKAGDALFDINGNFIKVAKD